MQTIRKTSFSRVWSRTVWLF